MVVNITLGATSATVGTVPNFPNFIGEQDQVTTSTSQVSAIENATTGVYTQFTQEYVTLDGTVLAVGSPASNFVRYAEYPGERLFKNVKFEVNANPLDNYTAEAMMYFQKFRVIPGKQTGFKRLIGQEVPVDAYSDVLSLPTTTASYSNAIFNGPLQGQPLGSGLQDVLGNQAVGSPAVNAATARKIFQMVNGPQTPQATQPALDLWIPLIFW